MKNTALIILSAFCLFATSCSVEEYTTLSYAANTTETDKEAPVRKVIVNASLDMVVDDQEIANSFLNAIATKYDGYVNSTGTYKTVIRVRNEHLPAAIEEIDKIGNVKYKKISSQEVTDQYEDLHIRLDNAQTARKRYLELLNAAETVAEALMVEKELERLNETIDLYTGKINRMSHLTSFATISINLKEEVKPGVLGYVGIGLYHSIKWLFVRG